MKKHLLGFALFSLIVGATVLTAAYYFNLTKPLSEIPAVNPNGEQNYKCNLSRKSAGQSVVVDLEAKRVFVQMDLPIEMNKIDRYSFKLEIFSEEKNDVVFTVKDASQGEIFLFFEKSFSNSFTTDSSKFSPRISYYARMIFSAKDANNRPIEISSKNVPVTINAGKRNY